MADQEVRQLGKTRPFGDVALLVAALTVVIGDVLAFDVLLQGLDYVVLVFDGQGQVVEVFFSESLLLAALALDDSIGLAPVDAVQDLLVGCLLQGLLQFVEDHVQELLGVLLDRHVHRLA